MKAKLSYKSKRNIVIMAVILSLIATISVATYFFVKGSDDTSSAFTDGNTHLGEIQQGEEGQENTQNQEQGNETQNNDGEEGNSQNQGDASTSTTNQNGVTINNNSSSTTNAGTTTETTGDVPNQDYVTERVEEQEVLVSENYAVEWAPLTIQANTTTSNLSIIRPIISQEKLADKTAVVENDVITYTINVKNSGTGNGIAFVRDTMPATSQLVTFVEGSIKIKGTNLIRLADRDVAVNDKEISKLTANDLKNGIQVNVPAKVEDVDGLVAIEFQVKVNENVTGTIVNKAQVNEGETNEVIIPVLTYIVEYYYQNETDGTYPEVADETSELRYALSDVTVTEEDKTSTKGDKYVFAEKHEKNVLEGTVNAENQLVLKVYFKLQYTVKYMPGTHGTFEEITKPGNDYGVKTPEYDGPTKQGSFDPAGKPGYTFTGWDPQVEEEVTEDITYTAQWEPNTRTPYIVKYYYQADDGTYPTEANKTSQTRYGQTDTTAYVTDEDKIPETITGKTYVFDENGENADNVLSGNIEGDGSLVLKVYFKQQYTVKYNPGTKGKFEEITKSGNDYGVKTPEYDGPKDQNDQPTGKIGYTFTGWNPEVKEIVTEDITYTAQWEANKNTPYIVKYYYQADDGTYPTEANKTSQTRYGETDTTAYVTDEDKIPETITGKTYVFDSKNSLNVLSGNIEGNGSLVLKVYFKQQYTIKYNPGTQGDFTEITKAGNDYNSNTPAYDGAKDVNGKPKGKTGYVFVKWNPTVEEKVTKNMTYTAQWEGLQVTKERKSVTDVDQDENLTYVDQADDVIKYEITVTNIGDLPVTGIILKDNHNVTVKSVLANGSIVSNTEKNVPANSNLIEGLNITLIPNRSIVVTVEQKITANDLSTTQVINKATATLNDKEYTDTEETEVKARYNYTIKYFYNGTENTDEQISGDAVLGKEIKLDNYKTETREYNDKKYEYIKYIGIGGTNSTVITAGDNTIEIYYGRPEITISKFAPETVNAGEEFVYTITIENKGHTEAKNVTVTDTLPTTTTYVEAIEGYIEATTDDNKNLSWTIDLAKNSKKTIKFKVKLDSDTVDSKVNNIATATYIFAEEEITKKSGDEETKVNGITVNYNELKIGQKLDDLNVIFVLDNSSSMTYPAEGEKFDNPDIIIPGAAFDASTRYHIAPGDEEKTRLYAAKEAINDFIDEFESADISVITFNTFENETKNLINLVNSKGKEKAKYNGIEYEVKGQYMSTNGNEYDGIEVGLECGAIDRGNAKANNTDDRENLKEDISKITVTSARGGLGTFICPALNMITNNQSTYLSSTKKNVVIIIADGVFEDEVDEANAGIINTTRNNLITTAEKNGKELEIFSVALGDSTHYEFNADALIALSTNESCVTAGDTNTLLNKFKEIHSEATDNTATKYSVNGKVTIGEASKNIIVPGTSTLNDMDDSITVKYMDGETEKTLFECTSSTQLQKYGLSIEGKYIYWDVNEYIRKQNITKLPTNIFKLKYHIPLK